MKNSFKLLSLVCLFLSSCQVKDIELVYPSEISFFNDGHIDHFPKKVPNAYYSVDVSQNLSNSHPHVWLNYIMEQTKFDSTKSALEKSALTIYYSEDSCLIVLDKHLNNDNWIDFDKDLRIPRKVNLPTKDCHLNKLPIPKFYDAEWRDTDNNDTGLLGYKLYVLEAKSGIFMDSTKLPNGIYTPEGWTHGYSKGVALNEENNEVIYWSDIW